MLHVVRTVVVMLSIGGLAACGSNGEGGGGEGGGEGSGFVYYTMSPNGDFLVSHWENDKSILHDMDTAGLIIPLLSKP